MRNTKLISRYNWKKNEMIEGVQDYYSASSSAEEPNSTFILLWAIFRRANQLHSLILYPFLYFLKIISHLFVSRNGSYLRCFEADRYLRVLDDYKQFTVLREPSKIEHILGILIVIWILKNEIVRNAVAWIWAFKDNIAASLHLR